MEVAAAGLGRCVVFVLFISVVFFSNCSEAVETVWCQRLQSSACSSQVFVGPIRRLLYRYREPLQGLLLEFTVEDLVWKLVVALCCQPSLLLAVNVSVNHRYVQGRHVCQMWPIMFTLNAYQLTVTSVGGGKDGSLSQSNNAVKQPLQFKANFTCL